MDPGGFANTLLAGNLVVYIGNSDGVTFSPDMLARTHAAMSSINTLLLPYSVSVSEVSDLSLANVAMDFGATSAGGSAADGVLGSYDPSVNPVRITLSSGAGTVWNY